MAKQPKDGGDNRVVLEESRYILLELSQCLLEVDSYKLKVHLATIKKFYNNLNIYIIKEL